MEREIKVKICGLQQVETIRGMDGLPIDEIGFIFAKSRRQVTAEAAAIMVHEAAQLRTANAQAPRTVGVFVNASLEELRILLDKVPLDVIQLHGDESPELCRTIKSALNVQVWKVFALKTAQVQHAVSESAMDRILPYQGTIDAALIDTAGGGTGQTFDWSRVPEYYDAAQFIGVPLYVAGGLHEGNVEQLLSGYPLHGVDISSGVETEGNKDLVKIRNFVERVKQQ